VKLISQGVAEMLNLEVTALSPDATFFDVEGIPVSFNEPLSGMLCAAWDTVPPRKFSFESAERNGAPITPEKFVALVSTFQAGA
jgi:hypothetical protein